MSEPSARWQTAAVLVFCLFVFGVPRSSVATGADRETESATVAIAPPRSDREPNATFQRPSPEPPAVEVQSKEKRTLANSSASASMPGEPALKVYRTSCLLCHDVDGRGEVGRDGSPAIPDFTDSTWQSSRTDAQLSHSILEGKGKAMPRMKNKLGSVDVKLMVVLVRAFREGKLVVEDEPEQATTSQPAGGPKPGNAAADRAPGVATQQQTAVQEGRRLFQKSCAMCHDRDGKGAIARESLPSIPDFTVAAWQQKRTNPQLLVSILDGKGTGMPAFRDKIARDRAREIVTYIRSFAPAAAREVVSASSREFDASYRKLTQEFEEIARQIRALSATRAETRASSPAAEPAPKKE
jgi:mono/diheme cytochrome c family protein